jgi:TRAP-type C4-dicarboxylate transport system permease large subunit
MESTVPWIVWFVGAMIVALMLVTFVPDIALFLPRLMAS